MIRNSPHPLGSRELSDTHDNTLPRRHGRYVASNRRLRHLEPFDFGGTKPNGQANLKTFTKGPHTLTTRLVDSDGYVDVISAAFIVT